MQSRTERAMPVQKQAMTVEEFDVWAFLPENRDKRLEYIDGEIIDVTSNTYSSELAMWILWLLGNFVHPRKLGHLTGEGAGYIVGGDRVSPDVAFVSKARQEQLSRRGWNPVAPDLAVEVVSPTDEKGEIEKKQRIYMKAGVLVWYVYAERKEIDVFAPGQPKQTLGIDDTLDGGNALPGLSVAVREIFERD
jgi:Uma2 family endonuclease